MKIQQILFDISWYFYLIFPMKQNKNSFINPKPIMILYSSSTILSSNQADTYSIFKADFSNTHKMLEIDVEQWESMQPE